MSDLQVLHERAKELEETLKMIEGIESTLKAANQRKRALEQNLTEAMLEAGVDSFDSNLRRFKLYNFYTGSWPKDPQMADRATEYLKERRADGLLKTTVTCEFGREEHKIAEKLASDIVEFSPVLKSGVHVMTLRSWVRKRVEEGMEIDLEILGLSSGQTVKITKLRR